MEKNCTCGSIQLQCCWSRGTTSGRVFILDRAEGGGDFDADTFVRQ